MSTGCVSGVGGLVDRMEKRIRSSMSAFKSRARKRESCEGRTGTPQRNRLCGGSKQTLGL